MPPPAELRKRPQDGISWVQKVAAVELGFRGAPGCLRGTWIYIGGRSTSVEQRGAHEGGGRAQGGRRAVLPRGFLVGFLMSTQVLCIMFVPKITLPKVSFRFGLCLIFLFGETLK